MKNSGAPSRNFIAFVGIISVLLLGQITAGCQAAQPRSRKQTTDEKSSTASSAADTVKTSPQANNKFIVYYFHGNARCPTCYKLENYAKSVVETDFSGAIKNGKLEWKTVNVEDKGNEHFSDDYKLYTKSVIISTQKDGAQVSWKNLDKIWQLIGDQNRYMEYIRKEVRACLEGSCL
jgi:hypothetical protein